MNVTEELRKAIIDGKTSETPELTKTALDQGLDPVALMNEILIPAMQEVGDKFERYEYFVPELLVSALAMQESLGLLRPLLKAGGFQAEVRVAMGTVKGDIHEIGKSIVCMVLEGAGFDVSDLGVDVPPSGFVKAVQDGVHVIGMSSLLTTSRDQMRDVIQALSDAGLRERVKVMVGGAAVTPDFAAAIGADAYGSDANEAVRIVKKFASSRKGKE